MYLDRAVTVLERYNITRTQGEESQMAVLLQDVVKVDEAKVLAIARTLQHMGTFNQLVRDNIEATNVSDRYKTITEMFDSIREDSKKMIGFLEDGKIDWKERLNLGAMKLTRGTTHHRFEKIEGLYQDVSKDAREALEHESAILGAYTDFRFAVKEGEILAYQVLATQEAALGTAKKAYETAAGQVTAYAGGDRAEISRLELARDEALRTLKEEDRKYQLVKDVAENLTVGYNVGETLIAKLNQTHELKDQVYRRSVTFFATNEHVFTTLDALYTSQGGLHEDTQSLRAMETGASKGLEDIAELAGKVEKAAIDAGYGETINAASVGKLVDAIVSFQTDSYKMIEDARTRATANAQEVKRIVEDGKERYKKAVLGFNDPAVLAA